MSIRVRIVNGKTIAICAARSVERAGDLYIDDGVHSALADKFSRDYNEMYGYDLPGRFTNANLVELEEGNNPAREWWDKEYGQHPRVPVEDPVLTLKRALASAVAEIKKHNEQFHDWPGHLTDAQQIAEWETLSNVADNLCSLDRTASTSAE